MYYERQIYATTERKTQTPYELCSSEIRKERRKNSITLKSKPRMKVQKTAMDDSEQEATTQALENDEKIRRSTETRLIFFHRNSIVIPLFSRGLRER